MWKVLTGLLGAVCVLHSQAVNPYLLPQPRHIVGLVLDSEGKPVSEAYIDHSGDRPWSHQTDSESRFVLDTRAPAFVIRKPGFHSELVRTQDAEELRITLRKLDGKLFPRCPTAGSYVGIEGWESVLRFIPVRGVEVSRQGRDIDYGARSYYIKIKSGAQGITHGSGPMWSFGLPRVQYVWRSVRYDEVTYDLGRRTVIDARGQLPDGLRWRSLGMFGESASYYDVDPVSAAVLDKFLDGACAKPTSPH
jgi:hypothetical protein